MLNWTPIAASAMAVVQTEGSDNTVWIEKPKAQRRSYFRIHAANP